MQIDQRIKSKYREFCRLYHPDLNLSEIEKEDASSIFSRGSYLFNTSPRSFLIYCKDGKYLEVSDELFDLLPSLSAEEKHLKIEEANRFFHVFEKSFTININPLKFNSLDSMMEHIVRIFKNRYSVIFRKVRNSYPEDIKMRIFMYERLDFTVQYKFLETWKNVYDVSVYKCRSIYNPEELVQVIKRTRDIPVKYISMLFESLCKVVSDVIEEAQPV